MLIALSVFFCLFNTVYSIENDGHRLDFFTELFQNNQINQRPGTTIYLISVDVYTAISPYTKELTRTEQIIWESNPVSEGYRIKDRVIEDSKNHNLCWHNYEYNDEGICENILIQEGEYPKDRSSEVECYFDDLIQEPMIDEEEIIDEATLRRFSIKRLFHECESVTALIHTSAIEMPRHTIIMKYAALRKGETTYPTTILDENIYVLPFQPKKEDPLRNLSQREGEIVNANKKGMQLLAEASDIKENLSYANYVKNEWDTALHQFFSPHFLKFSGYYQHDAESGSFGSKDEVGDKVRITIINGILNNRNDLLLNLRQLSSTHGNPKIHFVFRPTKGWMTDLVECTKVKFGYTSLQAHLLAEKWKELIQEMGGIEGGGKIIHYAHSIGGSDTYAARRLLTPQEQKMIHVITIGSPTMIPNKGFASAVNYVSKRDGVCLFDPVNYFNKLIYPNSDSNTNIVFLGTFLGAPFIEHMLTTQSYRDILSALGEQFQKEYNIKIKEDEPEKEELYATDSAPF